MINDDITQAISSAGAVTASQVVNAGIKAGKFPLHPELTAKRLRRVQDALDYGELLIDPPHSHPTQGDRYTLIAYYQDDGWWRHVIEIQRMRLLLITAFRDRDPTVRTEDVLRRPDLVTVRAWDEDRWRGRPKKREK